MNIAIAHYRINNTDGVSVEMQKWSRVLTEMGHKCIFVSGSEQSETNYHIDGIDFQDEKNKIVVENCYDELKSFPDEESLKAWIYKRADEIEKELREVKKKYRIDCFFVANILSLGWNLSAAIAFANFAKKHPKVKFVSVDSDIYWERELYNHPVVGFVGQMIDDYLLPDLFNVKHCVISEHAKREMIKRRGINSEILSKYIDISANSAEIPVNTQEIRRMAGAGENDLIILNPSRIVPRKAIEFSVEFVAYLNSVKKELCGKTLYNGRQFDENSKIILLLYGIEENLEDGYFDRIRAEAESEGVTYCYIGDKISYERNANKLSYMDAFYACDVVVVSSVLESWGSHILEKKKKKKPLVLFEYPVFSESVKKYGFRLCSLGNKYLDVKPLKIIQSDAVGKAVKELNVLLTDKEKADASAQKNYNICTKYFSLKILGNTLQKILKF